jgi:polar amino acid transport system ATP-binding protein
MPLVHAVQVRKSYGSNEVLKGIDMDVAAGEVVCLLGPSGSGKTTFLRCINQLEDIQAGRIWVDGDLMGYRDQGTPGASKLHRLKDKEIAAQRREIGMVFQRFNLFPHMTARENVMEAPIKVQGRRKAEVRAEADTLLDKVGLGDKANAYPNQLSGGQQQRVAIARALAMKPKLMLFDEPTSALDPELVGEVLSAMKDLAAQGWTMVVVTHEIRFAQQVADQVLFMDDGVIVERGDPREVLTQPRTARAQQFLHRILDPLD